MRYRERLSNRHISICLFDKGSSEISLQSDSWQCPQKLSRRIKLVSMHHPKRQRLALRRLLVNFFMESRLAYTFPSSDPDVLMVAYRLSTHDGGLFTGGFHGHSHFFCRPYLTLSSSRPKHSIATTVSYSSCHISHAECESTSIIRA